MDDDKKCKLLNGNPLENDAIGGGHNKIALAIFDLITQEEGGKVIAIEGRWGSGKSTVIKIL